MLSFTTAPGVFYAHGYTFRCAKDAFGGLCPGWGPKELLIKSIPLLYSCPLEDGYLQLPPTTLVKRQQSLYDCVALCHLILCTVQQQ